MIRFDRRNKHFPSIQFVLSACNTKYVDEVLRYINVSNSGDIVATDGVRLHIYNAPDLMTPGLYEVVKRAAGEIILAPVSEDLTFPDYMQLLSSDPLETVDLQSGVFYATAQILRALPEPFALNLDFLRDALAGAGDSFAIPSVPGPVFMYGENTTALLMPLRG